MRYLYILLFGLLTITNGLTAQEVEQDTVPPEKVKVDRSDIFEGFFIDGREIRFLKKNVALRQGDVYMYCDSATIEDNNVSAVGNVIIQQGDTLNIFADSLSYRGDTRLAELFGDVRLENKGQKLFTDRLHYDLNNKIASYFTGATLSNDTTHLVSKRGYYYVKQDEAFFKDSVIVFDPDFTLRSDTLKYATKKRLVTLLGPTLITQDSARIYCESGFYQINNKYAEFLTNPQYVKGEQKAYADRIIYDGQKKEVILKDNAHFVEGPKKAEADIIRYKEGSEVIDLEGNAHYEDDEQVIDGEFISYDSKKDIFKTEGRSVVVDDDQILEADNIDYEGAQGIATGNVVWVDTTDNITINCEHLFYNKETDYVKASGARPLVTTLIDTDTLFMASDTLISFMDNPEDSTRTLLGYHDVRILKNDLQVICDSMVYHTADSLFEFFVQPIIWSDTSQFYADTVRMQMADEKIDRIFLTNNAYIINSPDEVFFNQIKGKDITAFFEENELNRMEVIGNAESIYYARDEEDAYLGVNKAICSKMLIYFAENEIKDIYFYTQPKSNILPMKKTNHEEIKLPGFRWDIQLRPNSLADLLVVKERTPSRSPLPSLSEAKDSLNTTGEKGQKVEGEAQGIDKKKNTALEKEKEQIPQKGVMSQPNSEAVSEETPSVPTNKDLPIIEKKNQKTGTTKKKEEPKKKSNEQH